MDCQKKCKCKLLPCVPGIAAGILFAAVAGVLYGLGFPPNLLIFARIAAVLSIVLLILLSAGIFSCGGCFHMENAQCIQKNINCLLTGIFGTLLTAAAALSFSLSKAGVASILFTVGIAFFFVFMIVSFIRYLKCLAG